MQKYLKPFVFILVCAVALGACSSSPSKDKKTDANHVPTILRASNDATLASSLKNAGRGDMILLSEGTYSGKIDIDIQDLTLRGLDRNKVIFDGRYTRDVGISVAADGVQVENLTVQKFTNVGVHVSSTDRFSVQYVNALNNKMVGVLADKNSSDGVISHVYAHANSSAGIAVNDCTESCNTVVSNNTAKGNGIGFSAFNALKSLYVVSNVFSLNRTGIYVTSDQDQKESGTSVTIVGNVASQNNNLDAPSDVLNRYGYGIVVDNLWYTLVSKNRTDTNSQVGIFVTSSGDKLPNKNTVTANESRGNGFPFGFDIAYLIPGRPDVMSLGNCFVENSYSSSSVYRIQEVLPCEGAATGPYPSQRLRPPSLKAAPQYSDIEVVVETRTGKDGKLEEFPMPLGDFVELDLETVSVPDA